MKNLLLIVFLNLAFPLKSQEIKFSKTFDKIKSCENVNSDKSITFDGLFNNDFVLLKLNDSVKLNSKISTSPYDGTAYYLAFSNSPKKIIIGVNNQFITLKEKEFENFRYIYLTKFKNEVQILITNKPKLYK